MEFGLVGRWLVTILLLGVVALPLTAVVFPDREHGPLAIPLALAVLAVVGHLVGQLAFGWPAVAAGLTVLAGGSVAVAGRVTPDLRAFGEACVVFVAGFGLVIAIRAVDPAAAPLPLAVGEKFLDLGLLTTLDRTASLPPEDVWFAGEPVRYYYGGHMTTSLLATLTGTAPRFAYNLGLATFFGTLVTAAYGLAGAIAAGHGRSRRLAGGLAAYFVGIAGNLETAVRVGAWLLPSGIARGLAGLVGVDAGSVDWTPADFSYWDASRVVPVDPRVADPFEAATEFPLFAWLNGDLHAHMMSQPFTLLAAALLLAYWRTPATALTRRRLLVFGMLPPLAGLVGFVNLWSFPTVGGLTVLAIAFAPADPAAVFGLDDRLEAPTGWLATELRRVGLGLLAGGIVLVFGIGWTLPFWLTGLPGSSEAGLALWTAPTPLVPLLLVHGAFLVAFAPYLASRLRPDLARPLAVGVAVLGVTAGAILLGFPALGLVGPLLVGSWVLLRTRSDVGYETVLILGGAGLVLLVEVMTVEGERFNTIFKPYAHVWLLWAVATGVVLPRLAAGASGRTGAARERLGPPTVGWRRAGAALGLALVVTTGLYAGLALPAHVETASPVADAGGPTLDATAFVGVHYPAEGEAIAWLDRRQGHPTIVTAAPGGYWWRPAEGDGASAPASLTGLPTVLGWFHERQYRGVEPYERRLGHVETLYEGTPAERAPLLDRYDVTYLYVGPAERARYDVTVGRDPGLERVYPESGTASVAIYRVVDP